MIGVRRVEPGYGHKVVGLSYLKCVLDDERFAYQDVDVDVFMEQMDVKKYCLMLPFIDRGVFGSDFAVVFVDWEVRDLYLNKFLPSLCALLFLNNVF